MGLQEYNSRTRETELEQEIKQLKQVRRAGLAGKRFPDTKGGPAGSRGSLPRDGVDPGAQCCLAFLSSPFSGTAGALLSAVFPGYSQCILRFQRFSRLC